MLIALALLLQPAPGGVYVDTDGAVKTRDVGEHKKLEALRAAARKEKRAGELVFVSLPRAFKEPEAARHLGGMVKVQYVFVFEKDLVIAGPAEPIDDSFPGRPVGKRTGRPALQLDDLVVALRTRDAFGVSIEFADGAQEKMAAEYQKWKDAIAKEAGKRREAYDAIAQAGGPQVVRFFGIEPDTRFAFVCLEADYLMKRHSMGLDPTPVKAVPSVLDLINKRGAATDRSWFEVSYEPLRVSADGTAYEIRGASLQLKTEGTAETPYAENFTKHFAKLAEETPAWADLANLADLALVAAIIRKDKLAERIKWDVPDLKPAKVPVATAVPTAINFRTASGFLVVVEGGVKFDLAEAAARRVEGALEVEARRPETGWVVSHPVK